MTDGTNKSKSKSHVAVARRFFSPGVVILMFVVASAMGGLLLVRRAKEISNRPDNILLISLDTTRADHLSCYGYHQETSPYLDTLAQRGTLFERAYAHVPSTLPSHVTILSGLLPPQHGVRCNGRFEVPDGLDLLPKILQNEGFTTCAVVGAFPLAKRFGLDLGFDVYDDDFTTSASSGVNDCGRWNQPGRWNQHDYLDFERGADEVTSRAIAWLQDRRAPWFLFAHYFDPHTPYCPIPEYGDRFDSTYDGEIAFADRHIGRLIEKVDSLPTRTLIVVTADHGEGLGDHGEEEHSNFVYNTTVRVPLIFVLDGLVKAGHRTRAIAAHVDIVPTILNIMGMNVPDGRPGRTLVPALRGDNIPDSSSIYIETVVPVLERGQTRAVKAIVSESHKLIATSDLDSRSIRFELYDVVSDPRELINLAGREPSLTATMSRNLNEWAHHLEQTGATPVPHLLDDLALKRLRALGYLSDS